MMKNYDSRNSELENALKSKIDELASSVDCFDKISSRAFPEEKKSFADSEYTICDLENITGKKSHGFRFFPAALAAAAAIVICIGVIPKNGFVNTFFAKISGYDKKVYRELIDEITEETASGSYTYFDCTLNEFIENDVFVTPLYSCPFEKSDRDDISVRIFVKMYGTLPTNQIYAVQYEGSFEDANYIAAADSKAKFTDDELAEQCADIALPYVKSAALELVEKAFPQSMVYLTHDGSFPTYVSSLSYDCLYKYDDTIYPLANEIIAYTEKGNLNTFNYDYVSQYLNSRDEIVMFDTSAFADGWNNVVYFDGSSAKAEKSSSAFTKTDVVSQTKLSGSISGSVSFVEPFIQDDISIFTNVAKLYLYSANDVCGFAKIPVNPELRAEMRVYTRQTDDKFDIRFEPADTNSAFEYNIMTGNTDDEKLSYGLSVKYVNGVIKAPDTEDKSDDETIIILDLQQQELEFDAELLNQRLMILHTEMVELDMQGKSSDSIQAQIDITKQQIKAAEEEIEAIVHIIDDIQNKAIADAY